MRMIITPGDNEALEILFMYYVWHFSIIIIFIRFAIVSVSLSELHCYLLMLERECHDYIGGGGGGRKKGS